MKEVILERKVSIPSADYCILWKGGEVCKFLAFRKDANNETIMWKCSFHEADLSENLCSFGIKKFCVEHETAEIHYIHERK